MRAATGLTLSASATLLDAKYNSYPGRQCYPTQPDPSCAATGTFDASGRQIPLAAKFTSVISANYERPLSSSLTLVYRWVFVGLIMVGAMVSVPLVWAIGTLLNGMTILNLDNNVQNIVKGAVLLAAILLDNLLR